MKKFAVYDLTGMILRHGQCQDDIVEEQAGEGEFVLELDQAVPEDLDVTHYVVEGVIIPRPLFDLPTETLLAVGESRDFTIPDPCKVAFEGEEHVVTGGVLSTDGDMPATYEFRFEHWPYLPHTLKVIVNAA